MNPETTFSDSLLHMERFGGISGWSVCHSGQADARCEMLVAGFFSRPTDF
jgi:hypothetical protein